MNTSMMRMAAAVLLGCALGVLSGCGGDISKDPYLEERFREIESKLEKQVNVPLKVEDLEADYQSLEVRVGLLEKNPATGGAAAVANELNGIKDALKALSGRVDKLEAEVKAAGQRAAVAPKPTVAAKPAPRPTARPTVRVVSPTAANKTPTPTPAATATPKPTPQPPAGEYKDSQEGDTLASFAKRHNVTVEALIKANTKLRAFNTNDKLPLQQYWVPTSK